MTRKDGKRYTPKGEGAPVCGRKFCTKCGKWRLLVDFHVLRRTKTGTPVYWQPWCMTCKRLDQRARGGHSPRKYGRLSRHEMNRRQWEAIRSNPERMEAKREYWRIYKDMQRRRAGVPKRTFNKRTPGNPHERVPIEPFQRRFKELEIKEGLTRTEVAKRLGWYRSDNNRLDERRVSRALGLKKDSSHDRQGNLLHYTLTNVYYETAEQLVKALEMDPHEAGI